MGFRFRKSIRLLPGIRINLSKSGVSASLGKPGATINISERGTRGTAGIPGTGISYSETVSSTGAGPEAAGQGLGFVAPLVLCVAALVLWLVIFG